MVKLFVNSSGKDVCSVHNFPVLADVIYGYVVPILAIITVFLNSLAILVFSTTNRKSPTNIMLTVLAFSNMLSIGSISPMFFIVYGLNAGKKDVYYQCPFLIYYDAAFYITSTFHCISIWLTVVLGIERYIVVAFPMVGPRFCSKRNTIIAIVTIFIGSFVVMIVPNVPNVWKKHYTPAFIENPNATNSTNNYIEVCECSRTTSDYMFNLIYSWMRNILGTTVPSCILLVTTVLLIVELRKNDLKIQMLHIDNHASERREQKRMKRTSKLIVVITACFLVIELPYTVFYTWIVIEPHPHESALDGNARFTSSIIFNLLAYIGCNGNFLIFIFMSQYFRRKLRYFLCFRCLKTSRNVQNTYSFISIKSSHLL